MPLFRIRGQSFGALVDHADDQRGRSCLRGPPRCPGGHGLRHATVLEGREPDDALPADPERGG